MKSCIPFHQCFCFRFGTGLAHQGLQEKEDPLLFLMINASRKKIRYKLTKIIPLLPRKLWNSPTNFIIMLLHFVLITKIFWNYLPRISQHICANTEAAQSHLFHCLWLHVQSQAWRAQTRSMPWSAASSDTQSGCKAFPESFGVRNLSSPVSSHWASFQAGETLPVGLQWPSVPAFNCQPTLSRLLRYHTLLALSFLTDCTLSVLFSLPFLYLTSKCCGVSVLGPCSSSLSITLWWEFSQFCDSK